VADQGTGSFNFSDGEISLQSEIIGNRNTGSFTQSGGTHKVSDALYLGYGTGGNGTYNLNVGGAVLTVLSIQGGAGTSVYNLSGGTLKVPDAPPATTSDLGTILASASYFNGIGTVNVRNGGVIFSPDGYSTGTNNTGPIYLGFYKATVAGPLLHSAIAGDAATDGGLAKNGVDPLVLTAATTYNGATTGSQYDQVLAAGPLTLGGSLSVNLVGGFSLSAADVG
jgi:hypothetical protein